MRTFAVLAALTLGVAACASDAVAPTTVDADYALVLFGDAGTALETTMGAQGPRPFDGRSGGPARLPAELALSARQVAAIQALRDAFQATNAAKLSALKAVMEKARAAREAKKTREEVRAILVEARPIAESLRPAVQALHEAIRAVLTAEQRAWLDARRPNRDGPPRR